MDNRSRATSHATGIGGENRAAAYLASHGFTILARRFRTPVGEIDIVASHDDLLVFIEVKARARLDDAAYSLSTRQQQRIVAAAEAWLVQHPDHLTLPMRFDAILLAADGQLHHIPSAFDATP